MKVCNFFSAWNKIQNSGPRKSLEFALSPESDGQGALCEYVVHYTMVEFFLYWKVSFQKHPIERVVFETTEIGATSNQIKAMIKSQKFSSQGFKDCKTNMKCRKQYPISEQIILPSRWWGFERCCLNMHCCCSCWYFLFFNLLLSDK